MRMSSRTPPPSAPVNLNSGVSAAGGEQVHFSSTMPPSTTRPELSKSLSTPAGEQKSYSVGGLGVSSRGGYSESRRGTNPSTATVQGQTTNRRPTLSRAQSIRDQAAHFFGIEPSSASASGPNSTAGSDFADRQQKWTNRRMRHCSRLYGKVREPEPTYREEFTDIGQVPPAPVRDPLAPPSSATFRESVPATATSDTPESLGPPSTTGGSGVAVAMATIPEEAAEAAARIAALRSPTDYATLLIKLEAWNPMAPLRLSEADQVDAKLREAIANRNGPPTPPVDEVMKEQQHRQVILKRSFTPGTDVTSPSGLSETPLNDDVFFDLTPPSFRLYQVPPSYEEHQKRHAGHAHHMPPYFRVSGGGHQHHHGLVYIPQPQGHYQLPAMGHYRHTRQAEQKGRFFPFSADLVHLGAKYSPCMRRDKKIYEEILGNRVVENASACCIYNDQTGCFQTTSECPSLIAKHMKWTKAEPGPSGRLSGSVCGQDPRTCKKPTSVSPFEWPDDITKWPICQENDDVNSGSFAHMRCEITGKPCCIGIQGQCRITTREYCDFVNGYFHEEATLCSQVSCLEEVCGMIQFLRKDAPDQFYRLLVSLFLHAGYFYADPDNGANL